MSAQDYEGGASFGTVSLRLQDRQPDGTYKCTVTIPVPQGGASRTAVIYMPGSGPNKTTSIGLGGGTMTFVANAANGGTFEFNLTYGGPDCSTKNNKCKAYVDFSGSFTPFTRKGFILFDATGISCSLSFKHTRFVNECSGASTRAISIDLNSCNPRIDRTKSYTFGAHSTASGGANFYLGGSSIWGLGGGGEQKFEAGVSYGGNNLSTGIDDNFANSIDTMHISYTGVNGENVYYNGPPGGSITGEGGSLVTVNIEPEIFSGTGGTCASASIATCLPGDTGTPGQGYGGTHNIGTAYATEVCTDPLSYYNNGVNDSVNISSMIGVARGSDLRVLAPQTFGVSVSGCGCSISGDITISGACSAGALTLTAYFNTSVTGAESLPACTNCMTRCCADTTDIPSCVVNTVDEVIGTFSFPSSSIVFQVLISSQGNQGCDLAGIRKSRYFAAQAKIRQAP